MNEMKKNLLLMVVIVLLTYSLLDLNMIGITVAQLDHDVAVIGVTPFPTSVRLGEPVNITVVVENQGTNSETNFDVTVFYGAAVIETKNVQDLAAGASENLTFTWNTTGVREEVYNTTYKEKPYFIDATASTVPGETDTEDNTLRSDSTVRIISQYIAVAPESIVDPTLTVC
jgi:subtilase family serine protease